jgi:alkylation response protein AidB-like acyl-CoA dehydrogenase
MRDAPGPDFNELFSLARQVELDDGLAIDNAAVQEKLAEFYVRSQGLKFTKFRGMTALSRGQTPGPESSIIKVVAANKLQDILSYGLDLIGMAGPTMGDSMPVSGIFEEALMYSPALRLAGGTDEIMKNIIAERVLGLPQDPRVDKGVPWRDVPTGPRATGAKQ